MTLDLEAVADASPRFVGEIDQVPPMVSAIKVGGRRLHEIARAGEEVERAPRRVRIDRIEVESLEPGPYPVATIVVECGSGTYIRALAADLGAALGGFAHVGTPAPPAGRVVLARRGPPARRDRGRPRRGCCSPRATRCATSTPSTPTTRSPAAVAHGSVFPAAALAGRSRGARAVRGRRRRRLAARGLRASGRGAEAGGGGQPREGRPRLRRRRRRAGASSRSARSTASTSATARCSGS